MESNNAPLDPQKMVSVALLWSSPEELQTPSLEDERNHLGAGFGMGWGWIWLGKLKGSLKGKNTFFIKTVF